MTVRVILFLALTSAARASQQGYDYCISSVDHVLLSSGGRCVKVEGGDSSWDEAMDKCNGLGGYLFHVYSSQDLETLKQWALTTAVMNHGCWVGFKKIGLLNGNFMGYNMKWMIDKTAGIQTTIDNQCGGCLWWDYAGATTESRVHGHGWFFPNIQPAENLGKIFPYVAVHGGRPFTVCEFPAETNPNQVQFVGYEKQISPGSALDKSSVANAVHCAFKCSPLFYCQGFNVIGNVPNLECQIITQTIEDTYLGTLVDKSDGVYFERKQKLN